MFNSKVVFVLGAGASAEINMPVGRGLADIIARKMSLAFDNAGRLVGNGDHRLFDQVAEIIGQDEAIRAATRLANGLPFVKSIDEFLDYNNVDQSLVNMGKAAIVRSILEAEHGSKLIDTTTNPTRPTFTVSGAYFSWLIHLIRMLGQSSPVRLIENATFINFNYNRSLEFFLLNAIRSLYAISEDDAKVLVASADIFHPYGTVGKLKVFDNANGVAYGWSLGASQPLANRIRTYTEEVKEQARLKKVHESLQNANVLVFLGFAFHQQNMDLLRPPNGLGPKKIFATTHGISEADCTVVGSRLAKLFADEIVWGNMRARGTVQLRRDCSCVQLMEEYQLTLPNL